MRAAGTNKRLNRKGRQVTAGLEDSRGGSGCPLTLPSPPWGERSIYAERGLGAEGISDCRLQRSKVYPQISQTTPMGTDVGRNRSGMRADRSLGGNGEAGRELDLVVRWKCRAMRVNFERAGGGRASPVKKARYLRREPHEDAVLLRVSRRFMSAAYDDALKDYVANWERNGFRKGRGRRLMISSTLM